MYTVYVYVFVENRIPNFMAKNKRWSYFNGEIKVHHVERDVIMKYC